MTDREFLIWVHERLVNIHGEDPDYVYMRKLRAIIRHTPKLRKTLNVDSCNNMEELLAEFKGGRLF